MGMWISQILVPYTYIILHIYAATLLLYLICKKLRNYCPLVIIVLCKNHNPVARLVTYLSGERKWNGAAARWRGHRWHTKSLSQCTQVLLVPANVVYCAMLRYFAVKQLLLVDVIVFTFNCNENNKRIQMQILDGEQQKFMGEFWEFHYKLRPPKKTLTTQAPTTTAGTIKAQLPGSVAIFATSSKNKNNTPEYTHMSARFCIVL